MGLIFSVQRMKQSTRHGGAKFFPGHFASYNSLYFGSGWTDLGVSADVQCLKAEASQPGTICHPFFTAPVLSSLLQLSLTPPFSPVTCCSLSLALPLPPYCARFLFLNHLYEVCEAVSVCVQSVIGPRAGCCRSVTSAEKRTRLLCPPRGAGRPPDGV